MKVLIAFLFAAALLSAQVFEAAAIKINNSGRLGGGMRLDPARLTIINSTLKFCVQAAWNVKDFQVMGAAGWMDTEHFDIDAVAASPFTQEESRKMLRDLLTDRFGLVVRSEIQDKPGFALVAGRNGPKLPPPTDDLSVMFSRTASGDRTLSAPNVSMKRFADALSVALGSIVVDQTSIEGQYDVSFQWTPDSSGPRMSKSGEPLPPPPVDATPGPSIFTAVQEKFGLKIEARKVPMQVIAIERANRPTEN